MRFGSVREWPRALAGFAILVSRGRGGFPMFEMMTAAGLIGAVLTLLWALIIVICAYTAQKWAYLSCKELRYMRQLLEDRANTDL